MIDKIRSFFRRIFSFIKKHRWKFLILIIVLLIAGYGFFSNQSSAKPETIITQPVYSGSLIRSTTSSSNISSVSNFNAGFDSEGSVVEVYVKSGDKVEPGQALMKINDTELLLAYRQADLALRQAQSMRQSLGGFAGAMEIQAADLEVESKTILWQNAQRKYDSAVLKSGISGTVVLVNVKVGDKVTGVGSNSKDTSEARSAAAVAIVDTTNLQVKLQISEAEITELKLGQKAQITFSTIPGLIYEGSVSSIDMLGTQQNNVFFYNVIVTFKKENNDVKIGMIGDINIILEEKANTLIIPTNALKFDENGEYVEVQVGEGKFEKRQVKTGISNEIEMEILEGVKEGDIVKVDLSGISNGGGMIFTKGG